LVVLPFSFGYVLRRGFLYFSRFVGGVFGFGVFLAVCAAYLLASVALFAGGLAFWASLCSAALSSWALLSSSAFGAAFCGLVWFYWSLLCGPFGRLSGLGSPFVFWVLFSCFVSLRFAVWGSGVVALVRCTLRYK